MIRRSVRWIMSRAAATLALGAAFSIGGAAEALQSVHFLVQKDLDAVRVVKQKQGSRDEGVAKMNDGLDAHTVFQPSRLFTDPIGLPQISPFRRVMSSP